MSQLVCQVKNCRPYVLNLVDSLDPFMHDTFRLGVLSCPEHGGHYLAIKSVSDENPLDDWRIFPDLDSLSSEIWKLMGF